MVLASIINERKRREGFKQGIAQGIEQGVAQGVAQGIEQGVKQERERVNRERKRSNAKIRALAEKYGIPEDELPIERDDD